jgi:signal transduction histidine kinase
MAAMTSARPSTPLVLACLLTLAAAMLGGLLLGVAGDRKGMHALPDASGAMVEVLPDPVADFAFETVRAKPADAWRRWDGRNYIQAFYGEAVWVRITLRNPGAAMQRGVLADAEYYTDRVDLWMGESGGWRHERSGEWVQAAEKSIWGRDAAFFVEVPAGGERTVYLRLEDHFGVWLRPVWWPDARTFLAAQLRDAGVEAAYFGILFALIVYNGVLWGRLRFRDIGWYLGYLGSGALFMFMARAQHQVIGWAAGSPIMETPLTVALAASGFFLAQFARTFLELRERVPRFGIAACWTGRVMGLLTLLALTTPWMDRTWWLRLSVGGVAVTHAVLLAGAIAAWRKGSYHARFFVLSFGLLLAGMLPTAIIWLLAIPLGLSAMSMMLGSALEMLLLSLAIGDRFARMQQDKLAAQAQAMAETEQRHQIQEAYADELKHEVNERTRELAAANADKDRMMAVLGHDLRSPLTALTLSAEQVSVDRAAAAARTGFAAEAAQTGRALLLLLEDVVLWARLRSGPGRAVDQPADGVVAPAVELHRAAAVQRGVTLELMPSPGLRVRTDLVLTQTLVRNLTSNALKSARTRVVVRVSAAPDGSVRIGVRDDGPGLPPEVSAHLQIVLAGRTGSINPWHTASGLGLKLCLEIAQALGTRLEATVPEGGGAEISFTLPRGGK